MFLVHKSHSVPVLTLLAGLLLVTACELDKSYEINDPKAIDLTVTAFEDGVAVPLGKSAPIKVGDLVNSVGGINDFIEEKNDELILKYNGSASLNDKIAELDLANTAVIDGVSFSEEFSYHVGDFSSGDFTFDGESRDLKYTFEGMDLLNVPTSSISEEADELSFSVGLDEFKDVINNNASMDLGTSIGNITYDKEVLSKADVSDAVAPYPDNMEIPVPAALIPDVILPDNSVKVTVAETQLDANVTALKNIKTNPAAKLVVTLNMDNVCFTEGNVTPDVDLDFSSLINIKGGSKINLKDMVLTKANGWTLTKSFDVEGLVKTEYVGSFSLDGSVPVSGKLTTADAKTTKAKVAATSGDMTLKINVHFSDFTVASADIAVTVDPFERNEIIKLGQYDDTQLPKGIKNVKTVYLDETKPLKIKITPKNLNRLKEKSIPFTYTITFPPSMKVQGADGNGQMSFSGDLANGPVEQQILLTELYPVVTAGKLSLNSNVDVNAKVEPKNIVIDSSNLPQNADEDLGFSVVLEGTPVIKDYEIVLGNYEENVDINGDISISAKKLGDLTGIHVKPEGTPALTIAFNIPSIKGVSLKPGNDGLKISLPSFLVFDAAAVASEYNFNASDNSITLKGAFPAQVSLPIKELYVNPVKVDGVPMINGSYSAKGAVTIPSAEVSQSDLAEAFGTDIGLTVALPEIKAASITLDDNLSFDVNQKFNLLVKNIPEQLKKVDEILLDNVFVNLDAQFEGLPSSSDAPFAVDLTVTLPGFISPNVIPIKGNVVNGKLSASPVKLEKLYNIDLSEASEIKGDIIIKGSISSNGKSIDISALQPDIKATISASIQNSNGKIAIAKASGVFSYSIDEQTTSLSLDSMPDILKTATLDFADPVLNITIATNLGIPLAATIELVPFINGAAVTENAVVLNDIQMPYSASAGTEAKKTFSLCKTAASAPAGSEFIQADITRLLKKIPDSIEVKINAGVVPTATAVIEPAATYTLNIDYGISVPLSFGKDFEFSTSTEVDFSQAAEIVAMGDFIVEGKVINESPLNLAASMELLDANGNVIPQAEKTVINIKGGSKDPSPFVISLSTTDKSKTVSKAKITVTVTAVPNQPVKTTDTLQFIDLIARGKGITVKP